VQAATVRTGTTTIAELQILSELQQNEILSKEIEIEKLSPKKQQRAAEASFCIGLDEDFTDEDLPYAAGALSPKLSYTAAENSKSAPVVPQQRRPRLSCAGFNAFVCGVAYGVKLTASIFIFISWVATMNAAAVILTANE
jgi:hypothetical protein